VAQGMRAEKFAEWQERLARFERSGTTITQFCLDEGISTPSFFLWRRRLGGKPGAAGSDGVSHFAGGSARSDRHARQDSQRKNFVAVRVRDDVNGRGQLTTLTAELPGGTRLTIPVSDADALQRTLVALIQADADCARGRSC
jgi:hypothetical protein